MSETGFTRGPWQAMGTVPARHVLNADDEMVEIWGVDLEGASDGYEGVRVGYLFLTHNGDDERLILAAPELYAALEPLAIGPRVSTLPGLSFCFYCRVENLTEKPIEHRDGCPVLVARAALAKVRGEVPA